MSIFAKLEIVQKMKYRISFFLCLTYKTEAMNRINNYETGLSSLVHFNHLFFVNLINMAGIFSRTEQLRFLQGFDFICAKSVAIETLRTG